MRHFVVFLSLFIPTLASATLGGKVTSVDRDARALGAVKVAGTLKANVPKGIKVFVMNASAITIKEFADANGNIFALSWRGLKHPDLKILLGQHFSKFKETDDVTPKGRKELRRPIVTEAITATFGGHMPHLHGLVYLNGQLPEGIHEEDLL